MTSRKRRGRESEIVVAEYLRQLFPYARAAVPGARGPDVEETPALCVEVKSRRGLSLPEWSRQAVRNANGVLPVLVVRGDGQGPATIAQWSAVVPLRDLVQLLSQAGYGTRPEDMP